MCDYPHLSWPALLPPPIIHPISNYPSPLLPYILNIYDNQALPLNLTVYLKTTETCILFSNNDLRK